MATSDSARHVTLLAVPSYLLTDGKSLLVGDLARLAGALVRLIDPSWQAVLAHVHLGGEFFFELRVPAPVGTPPEELAKSLRTRLEKAGEDIEQHVATLSPDPYGRLIVLRFPRMVQLAVDYTPPGAEGRQAVLPLAHDVAAHNLALGTALDPSRTPGRADRR